MPEEPWEDVLAFMVFPNQRQSKIGSTSWRGQPNNEIKRRTNVVGIFPNEAAICRRVASITTEQYDECAVPRKYMSWKLWRNWFILKPFHRQRRRAVPIPA